MPNADAPLYLETQALGSLQIGLVARNILDCPEWQPVALILTSGFGFS